MLNGSIDIGLGGDWHFIEGLPSRGIDGMAGLRSCGELVVNDVSRVGLRLLASLKLAIR